MSADWTPSEHGSDQSGLQRRVARGLTWTFLDNWGSQLIGLLVFALLARQLTETDVGLVALAAVFVSFFQLFVDQGMGDALVQRKIVTRSQIDTAFWVSIITGTVLMVVTIVLSGPIATLLGEPELGPILAVLSVLFIITALSSVQMALLRREMAFRSLAVRRLTAITVGGVFGIAAAFAGLGAWALVIQQIVFGITSVLTLWWVSPWRPGLRASRADVRELLSFGSNIVGSDVLGYLSRNTDNLLIGAFLGPAALGLYAVGYRLLETSQTLLVNAARKLGFPVFSSIQGDPDRLQRAYGRVNRMVSVLILPGYIGLALVAQEAIVVLFGQRWAESGPVASILFLIGPVLTVQVFSGALLNATGYPHITLRFRLLTTVVHVTGFLIAVLFFQNILAVAAAFVIGAYLLAPLNLYLQQRYAGVSISAHLMQIRWVALATLVMAGAVLAVKLVLGDQTSNVVLLSVEVVVGGLAFFAALTLFERGLVAELLTLVTQVIPGAERVARALHIPVVRARPRRRLRRDELDEELMSATDIEPTSAGHDSGIDPALEPETER